jgi:predicted RNA methylase
MKIWSDVEYVYRCLADTERTGAFKTAIEAAVKPGDIVLDLGTGSGIMAIFAARAGAGKIYSVEIGPYLSRVSEEIFRRTGYDSRIVPLRMDARDVTLQDIEKPAVVVCEMITTGLLSEMHGVVINALKASGVIDTDTCMIPAGLSTTIALVSADFEHYGVELQFPIFIDYFTRALNTRYEILSEPKAAHSVQFSADFSEEVRISEILRPFRKGRVNGVLLKSFTSFSDGSRLGTCTSYCQPVILPVSEIEVAEGDRISVRLEYQMSAGFDTMKCDLQMAS